MKRTFIIQLLALAVMTAVHANPIGRQQARQMAETFLQKSGRQLGTYPAQSRGAVTTDEPLYIFNSADGRGFVVISGDDRTEPVLGYTEQGCYDETDMPEGLRAWLEQMKAEISSLGEEPGEVSAAARTRTVDIHEAVKPLVATSWSQGSGKDARGYLYNTLCPLSDTGLRCITGCVATVGAQLMYYWHYPLGETAVVPGYTKDSPKAGADTSADLPQVRFNWDAMKLSYTAADTLTEAERAVSELMLYCGYAAQMNYGPDASSANVSTLAAGMAEYFGYDPNTWKYVARNDYSIREWDELIYNEVAARRPVIISGKRSTGDGHAFLCDGYDGEGFFHINWGWSGNYNGYFRLQSFSPYGTKKIENSGYIFNQYVVIGIQPYTGADPEPEKNPVATVSEITIDGSTVSMRYSNKNKETYGMGFGFGEITANGKIKVLDKKYESLKDNDLEPNYGYKNRSFDFSTYKLSDGTHKLVPISIINGETAWRQCKPHELWFEVKASNGGKTVTITQHPVSDLKATQIEIIGNKYAENIQQVNVTVENLQDERKTPLFLFASPNYTKGDYVYAAGSAIEEKASEVLTFYFKPDKSGVWNLWVTSDEDGKNVIGQSSVVIQAKPTGTVTLEQVGADLKTSDNSATLTLTVKNTGTTTSIREMRSWLHEMINGSQNQLAYQEIPAVVIPAGESQTVSVTFSGLEEGKNYRINVSYATSSDAESWKRIVSHNFTYGATGIDSAVKSDAEGRFYDLNGNRLTARPSRQGIYIERKDDGTSRKLIIK